LEWVRRQIEPDPYTLLGTAIAKNFGADDVQTQARDQGALSDID